MFSRDRPALNITAMSSHQERTYVIPGRDGLQSTAAGALANYVPCSGKCSRLISYGGPTLRRGVLNVFKWGQRGIYEEREKVSSNDFHFTEIPESYCTHSF